MRGVLMRLRGMASHRMVEAGRGGAVPGEARGGVARRGAARRGMARRGVAWRGMACLAARGSYLASSLDLEVDLGMAQLVSKVWCLNAVSTRAERHAERVTAMPNMCLIYPTCP